MRNYIVLIASIIFGFLNFSCQSMDDYQLTETVFIEDTFAPGLPVYSEWGYNAFGAYIDRNPFISTRNNLPSKIIIRNDTLKILMRGEMNNEAVDLTFSFAGVSYDTYDQLIDLHNRSFDLVDESVVELKKGNEATERLDVFDGKFEIMRAQHLLTKNLKGLFCQACFNSRLFIKANLLLYQKAGLILAMATRIFIE